MPEQVEILLVDDNDADVELTVRALRAQGIASRIHTAANGEAALEFLFCRGTHAGRSFTAPPRVVLLDLKMPKVDGIEVLRAIRGDPRTRAIPVAILTSSKEQRDLVESYRLGVNAYVQKPVGSEDYRQVIEALGNFWLGTNQPPPSGAFSAG